jgi:hypothetical protein
VLLPARAGGGGERLPLAIAGTTVPV